MICSAGCDRPQRRSRQTVRVNNESPGITGCAGPGGRAFQFIKTCKEISQFGLHSITVASGNALVLVKT